jgi:hypothetical protein
VFHHVVPVSRTGRECEAGAGDNEVEVLSSNAVVFRCQTRFVCKRADEVQYPCLVGGTGR